MSTLPSGPTPPVISIAAALLCRADGRTLLVRKRGTAYFMQPGGKIEPGETPAAALARELAEELGLSIDPREAEPLGRFEAPAANEPGWVVRAEIFRVELAGEVKPGREIEEVRWVDAAVASSLPLAPLTRDQLLPLHRAAEGRIARSTR